MWGASLTRSRVCTFHLSKFIYSQFTGLQHSALPTTLLRASGLESVEKQNESHFSMPGIETPMVFLGKPPIFN
jgi:hypothetical protein